MNHSAWLLLPLAACVASAWAQAGKANAGNANNNVAAACVACHGQQGEGQASAGFPRIAGQPAPYLMRQLEAFANGQRLNEVMTPIAKGLTPQQRSALAQYYAGLPPAAGNARAQPATATPAASGANRGVADIFAGRAIAEAGLEGPQIQACANCHGPQGIGQQASYPYLAGQYANYLVNALGEWKSGKRNSDPSGQMLLIGKALSTEQIQAVASYYAAQPPSPVAVDRRQAQPLPTRRGPAIVSGPTKPAASPQGSGSGQGGTLQGGSQGVGSPPANQPQQAPTR